MHFIVSCRSKRLENQFSTTAFSALKSTSYFRKLILLLMLLSGLLISRPLIAQDKANIKWGKLSAEDFSLPKSAAIDSNADAVIIADMGYTSFVGNRKGWFNWIYKRKTRIKIINKKGFDASNLVIHLYNDEDDQEKLTDITGSTYNLENGQVRETKLDKKEIFDVKQDINHALKKLTMPAVREGSIIEYTYTINSPFYYNIPSWSFQHIQYPCVWSEYEVNIPMTMVYVFVKQGYNEFHIQTANRSTSNFRVTQAGEKNSLVESSRDLTVTVNTNDYRWVMKDIPSLNILRLDPYITSAWNYIDKVEFQLSQVYNGETAHDVTNNWAKATDELLKNESFGIQLSKENEWLNKDLDNITAGLTDPLLQAKKIFYFVAHNFTCTEDNSTRIKTSLEQVFKKHSGGVGEINLLLVTMLRKKNILADPVILSTREFGINYPQYPIMDRLNYVVCYTKINDKTYYLDATQPLIGFGHIPEECYNGHARIISDIDSGSIYFYTDSIKELKRTSVIIINDEKGNVGGGFQSNPGYYESLNIRESVSKQSEKEFFKKIQTSYGSDLEIANTGIDSLDQLESPISYHYDFDFKTWKDQDLIYFNPMMSEAYRENPFRSTERKYLVEMPYATDEIYTVNMEIPTGYLIDEIPKSVKVTLNDTDGFFEYIIQQSGSDIQLRCHLKLKKATFSANEYKTLRDFYGFVVKKEAEQIVFKKKK